MSKTLFWYIFRDLFKIFFMTLGVLAGIMSFGGLLKPMMQYGLSGAQVMKMLTYFMPATLTYALPIAALFATTMVYGRLSSDNEITACRATGISYLVLTMPAVILGLILSTIALTALCFIVPYYTLQVEKVIFSSLSDIVVRSIEREHRIKLPDGIIYADSAEQQPSPPDAPGDEVVVLNNPMFCFYETIEQKEPGASKPVNVRVPSEFYTARRAVAVIHHNEAQASVEFSAHLEGGATFSRHLAGADVAAIRVADIGPIRMGSPIRENTKFMTIRQLRAYYQDPTRHRDIQKFYADITRSEQENSYTTRLGQEYLHRRELDFQGLDGENWTIIFQRSLRLPYRDGPKLTWIAPRNRDIRLVRKRHGEVLGTDDARSLTIKVRADADRQVMQLSMEFGDVLIGTDDIPSARSRFLRTLSVPMPPEVARLAERGPEYYLKNPAHSVDLSRLRQKLPAIQSGIHAEIHSRASFSISCLILVLIGAELGMLFKTGNFLSSFAISVIPAFLCIALMVTGQHVAEDNGRNLQLGLGFIWSGNAIVGTLAVSLLAYLRRQ